jgi:transposase
MRYNGGMIERTLPLVPQPWATVSVPGPVPHLEQLATLWLENAMLRAENAAQQARMRDLAARLGQSSANSSHTPSSDRPQAPRKQAVTPSRRKRGGQPGHRGVLRPLLPVEQVDEIVGVAPERCRHCQQPFPRTTARRRARGWRHQVVELLPLAVRVTEDQMVVRRWPACGKRTRAALPAGVPRRPFGPRLTAVIALLSGRYRLSRREVRQALHDLWGVTLSLGAVVRQEQVQSVVLAPVVQGGPGRSPAGRCGLDGRNRLATGAAPGLAVDGSNRRANRVSD